MAFGSLAGVPHVGEGGRAQQVRDQVELLDRGRGLKQENLSNWKNGKIVDAFKYSGKPE